jgi:hypothetical protein
MPSDTPHFDYTPEEKARIYAKFRAEFTADDLAAYIEDDDEKFPAEQVLAELEEMVRLAKAAKEGMPDGQ